MEQPNEGPYRDEENPYKDEIYELQRQLNDYRGAGYRTLLAWERAQQEIGCQRALREKEIEARHAAEKEAREERYHKRLMLIFCIVSAIGAALVVHFNQGRAGELRRENRALRELVVRLDRKNRALDQEAGTANLMTFGIAYMANYEFNRLETELRAERDRRHRLETELDGLRDDLDFEHAYSNTLQVHHGLGLHDDDPLVLDDQAEICHLSQLPGAIGRCP